MTDVVTSFEAVERGEFMIRSRRRFLPFALIAMLVVLGFAPQAGRAQDEQIELLVWDQFTGPTESEVVESIYAGFTEQHPNITIRREAYQTDQMRQTVNTAMSSGEGPDIIFYDTGPGFAGVLAEAGLIAPLTDYAAQFGWTERIIPSAIQGASIDGTLYGMPLQVDLIGMYYNQTLIDEAGLTVPTTLDELKTFCGTAAEAGYTPMAFSDNPGWQAGHQFSMTSTNMVGPDAMGELLYNNVGRWDTPEMVVAINAFFVELREAGCYTEDANALTYEDGNSLFYAGDALLHPTGSWLAREILDNMPDQNVGFTSFPALTGGQGSFYVTGLGSAYYISANSEHPAEAAQFIDYLFSPEVAQRWVGEAGFMLPMEVDTSSLDLAPLVQTFLDILPQATAGQIKLGYNIDVLAPPQFNEVMTTGFQAIISGDKTAEEQAAELQAAWEAGMSAPPATPEA
jgi:raffinose/stachyose/melibiose transport system substrate-binding protein